MAYYTQTDAASTSLIERALASTAQLLHNAKVRHARNRVYRTTLNELSNLSDRDLGDLGLSSSMLKGIAWEAAVETVAS